MLLDVSDVRLDDQLCFALHAASRSLTAAYREPLGRLGLTYTQYLVLMVLWETDGLSVGEVGRRLRLDSGTLSPVLRRLEAQGLLERRHSTVDERSVRVHLTPSGSALSDEAPDILQCARATVDLDEEEADVLRRLARRVATLDQPPIP